MTRPAPFDIDQLVGFSLVPSSSPEVRILLVQDWFLLGVERERSTVVSRIASYPAFYVELGIVMPLNLPAGSFSDFCVGFHIDFNGSSLPSFGSGSGKNNTFYSGSSSGPLICFGFYPLPFWPSTVLSIEKSFLLVSFEDPTGCPSFEYVRCPYECDSHQPQINICSLINCAECVTLEGESIASLHPSQAHNDRMLQIIQPHHLLILAQSPPSISCFYSLHILPLLLDEASTFTLALSSTELFWRTLPSAEISGPSEPIPSCIEGAFTAHPLCHTEFVESVSPQCVSQQYLANVNRTKLFHLSHSMTTTLMVSIS